ncbi:MAG: hypothetical protein JWN12_58 [Candidatus Saccharibacteria bacterium]|nr:hypothetical protein [Candidatus Saccharibacteria bacterium]
MKKLKDLLTNRNSYIDKPLVEALETSSDKPPVKLIEHCNSLNNSYKKQNYTTVAILIRGVLDYVPTIFGFANTAQVYSELSGKKTFKDALRQLDQASRNLADDGLHSPARKDETLKVSKLTVDNLQGNLAIVLAETAQQLRTKDLRDEGNAKLAEQRAVKPKRQKSQLETFEDYIVTKNWTEQEIDGDTVWICESDNLYQIYKRGDYDEFSEPWTKVYPDSNGSGKYSVDLVYNGTIIKRFTFIYCDGGRISVVMPELYVAPEFRMPNKDMDDKTDHREYFWEKDSLKYKLMKLIGSFYIYNTPEGVAKQSDITIK